MGKKPILVLPQCRPMGKVRTKLKNELLFSQSDLVNCLDMGRAMGLVGSMGLTHTSFRFINDKKEKRNKFKAYNHLRVARLFFKRS
jgi:hypothetical protein